MKISRKTRPEDGRNPTLLECFKLVLYRFWFFSVGTAFYKEKFSNNLHGFFLFQSSLPSHSFVFILNSFYLKLECSCHHPTQTPCGVGTKHLFYYNRQALFVSRKCWVGRSTFVYSLVPLGAISVGAYQQLFSGTSFYSFFFLFFSPALLQF